MKFFLDFIRSRIITLVCIIIAAVIFAVVLSLYNLPSEPVLYALLLSLAAVTAIGAVIFYKGVQKAQYPHPSCKRDNRECRQSSESGIGR